MDYLIRMVYRGPDAPDGRDIYVPLPSAKALILSPSYQLHYLVDEETRKAVDPPPLTEEEQYQALLARYFATCDCLKDQEKRIALRAELAAFRERRLQLSGNSL